MAKVTFSAKVPNQRLIREAMREIAERPRRSILISAGKKALKPMRDEAKRRVPKLTGNTAESIGTLVGRNRGDRYAANVILAPRVTKKYDGWYAHIIEGGARGVVKNKGRGILRKGTRYRRDIPARPFFEPAVKNNLDEAGRTYAEGMNKALESRIRRLQRVARKKAL